MFGKKIETCSLTRAGGMSSGSVAGSGPLLAALLAALFMAGCGGKEEASGAGSDATTAAVNGGDDDADRGPCALLSGEQVTTVLPGHDGGSVMHSGGSLIKGVDSYQCSYTRVEGTDAQMFIVIVHKAADDAAFDAIKPGTSLHEDDEAVQVGDAAWVYGDAQDLKLKMLKGQSIVELELMTPDAATRKGAVVELARVLAGKVQEPAPQE